MATRLTAVTSVVPRTWSPGPLRAAAAWSRGDSLRTLAWFTAGVLARAPLTARVEGVLDHDQSIVGLMALDIAAGRRWPIYFDGQRYMGAIEPYVSAVFVALFGHSPAIVALSPLLFFGLFVAAQYALWRVWSGRATAHMAALIAIVSAPMLAVWSVVPRGGYIELLAWAVPVLGIYRAVTRSGAPTLTGWRQAGWGFLFTLGYFLNPLSLIVYVTLALDWTLGRHGADLRQDRGLTGKGLDGRFAPASWCVAALAIVLALGACCHVVVGPEGHSPFVFCLGLLPPRWGAPLAVAAIGLIVGAVAVWTGGAGRTVRMIASHRYFALGGLAALSPALLFQTGLALGWYSATRALPIWIRAPWDLTDNVRDGLTAVGTLLGCDPHAPATVLIGQGITDPPVVWPLMRRLLEGAAPLVASLALVVVGVVAWHDRERWKRAWRLRGDEPATGTQLALLGLMVAGLLYMLQATSPNASSVRYLVPTWIFLPGLLASGLALLPKRQGRLAAFLLLGAWFLAQLNLWVELDRPSPLHPLAAALEERRVRGIVADTPVALMVTNLSHGRVGALEFHSNWMRLGGRYLDRFPQGQPVTCVVDTSLMWYPGHDPVGLAATSLEGTLRDLARRFPGRVRVAWRLDSYEVWEADVPLTAINADDTETGRLCRSALARPAAASPRTAR